jgi:signal transduction histidine kinase/ActR/RegA family two-component response regulator
MNDQAASKMGSGADLLRWRGRVYGALAVVFLAFVVGRAFVLWWQYDEALRAEQRRAETLVSALTGHLDRTIGAIESALSQLAAQSERIGGPRAPREAWAPILAATMSGLADVGSLNLIDADGTVTHSTNPAATGTSRRDAELYRRLSQDPAAGLVLGPPLQSADVGGIVLPAGLALHDRDGRFVGIVAATFRPERLETFYRSLDIGPHGVIQLLRADGHLMFRQPPAAAALGDTVRNQALLAAGRGGNDRGAISGPFEPGGEGYLTAWQRLPGRAVLVALSISKYDALDDWRSERLTVVGVTLGMALMFAIAGLWITASSRMHARALAERDRADAALRVNREWFQAVMERTPLLVFVKDLAGRYTFVNSAASNWPAAISNFAVGKTSYDIMAKDAADSMVEADRKVVVTRKPLQREIPLDTPIGRRTMLSVKFPLFDAHGYVEAVGTIATDVTDQKLAEAKLAQAQRMEAIGQLTGGVAHDFNNMLTAILLNADVLATEIPDESLRQLADAMRQAAERGADLTKRLLAFGRRQSLAPQPTDVNELLASMEPLMQRTLGQHIEIRLQRERDLWPATVDPSQLENAIVNLALNARDAMPGGGRLTITTGNFEIDEHYLSGDPDVRPGAYVMVAVSDTGSGMPPEVVARAFDPFFTTKEVGKGSGLGLSMVYGFVKQSGGHIRIYSEPDVGTVVRLFLPRSTDAAGALPAHPAPDLALPTGTETILLVEDDPLVLAFTEAQLSALGYRVVSAANAHGAVAAVEEGCVPDLLFTDMVMPGGMNGRALAEVLRRRLPGLKVLYTSGYAHGALTEASADSAPVRHLLGKPYRRHDLATKVREVLDEPAAAA